MLKDYCCLERSVFCHLSLNGQCDSVSFKEITYIDDIDRILISLNNDTVEPDWTATEMSAFPSNSSRNKCDIDPINGKTTPI